MMPMMPRALLAAVFAVVMCLLTMLPGTGGSSTASGTAPDPATSTTSVPAASEDPAVTDAPSSYETEPSAPQQPVEPVEPVEPPVETVPPRPACTPAIPLVDAEATPEATCLAATLDEWRASGRYGLGQQLNVSSRTYLKPLNQLRPMRPAVVGFDLDELALGETYGFPQPPLETLLGLAEQGVVLTASWHTPNPSTGGDSYDRRWQDLGALLDPSRQEYAVFWDEVDAKLELLLRLQTGDGGRSAPAAVLFRPLHEANGDWFWWAQGTDPATYKALYATIQQRASDAGVHNVVWGWSANAVNDGRITDPLAILPDRVDLAGVDSYEPMAATSAQGDLELAGLAELAGRVPRSAVTEAGPHGSKDGAWDPARVAPRARALGVDPAYVMMWFDDGSGDDGYTGRKQLGSLRGGEALLSQCTDGVCRLP